MAIFHHSPIGVAILDLDGNILQTNKSLQEFLGYSAEELMKKTFRDITHPEDVFVDDQEFSALIKEEIDHYKLKKRYYQKNGQVKWGKLFVTLINSGDEKNNYVIGMVEDISEEKEQQEQVYQLNEQLKKQNQKLFALHRIADFGYYETDLVKNRWTATPEFYQIFGFDQENEPFSQEDFQSIVHPEDIDAVMQQFNEAIIENKPFNYEYRCIHRKTGNIIFVNSYSIVEYKNNNPVRIFGIKHDITKLKQLNKKLLDANKKLEEFAYVVSHDMKEPVRGIVGMLGLLEKKASDKLNDKEKEYVKLAVNSSRRMNKMISDLLEYSRTGKIKEQYQEIAICEVIEEAKEGLKEAIEASGAKILLPDEDIKINGFPGLLSRLMQNLFSNAIKYKSEKPPVISISVIDKGAYFEIAVKDNGIGIAPEHHERIFSLFSRIDPDRDDNSNGMGLSLSKNIASIHNGTIKVKSGLGKGSEFIVSIAKAIPTEISTLCK